MRFAATFFLGLSLSLPASAQVVVEATSPEQRPEPAFVVPEPPGAHPTPPLAAPALDGASAEPTDAEVIRWASAEIGREDGRPVGQSPPVPPFPYLGHGAPEGPPIVLRGEEARDALRLFAEIGGGALGTLVGGGVGLLVLWGAAEGGADPDLMLIAGAAGGVIASLSVTAGVTLGGDLTEGRGNFGYAFIGQLIGSLAAMPIIVAGLTYDAPAASLVAAAVLPLAGAVIAYELAHAARGSVATTAFLAPSPHGVLAGLAGPLPD